MAEFNQEQVKTFLTNLGLEETDFTKISTEEITDFEPFVSKIKGGIAESLKYRYREALKRQVVYRKRMQ